MDDITSATGISSAASLSTIGAVVWYIKNRILKYEKSNAQVLKELREATSDNKVQSDQIARLQDEVKELRTLLLLKKNG